MTILLSILAQPLAPDYIWFALLLVAALAWMHRLDALRNHMAGHQHGQHLHQISHRLHERMMHRHP